MYKNASFAQTNVNKGGMFMTQYDDHSKVKHWFPKVNHMVDDYVNYPDTPETMIVNDSHDAPYIGDFPPGDDYKKHQLH